VLQASGHISGTPLDVGCLTSKENNDCKRTDCLGMEPGETYDLVVVCEVTDCNGDVLLGEKKELSITMVCVTNSSFCQSLNHNFA
jgi:hypothetical protein